MKLLRHNAAIPVFPNGVVATIGNFDGVHPGHQALLSYLHFKAKALQLPLVLIVFEPQPAEYFSKTPPVRLSNLREKLMILPKGFIDYVYCLKFDEKLATTSAHDFAKVYFFLKLNAKYLLVGKDFHFGHKRHGDVALLTQLGQQNGCTVETFPDFFVQEERVSSTKIREALANGDLTRANHLLGRSFSLCGRIVHGQGRGKEWGVPTANVDLKRSILPLKGVYCVQGALQDKLFQGVANIGTRPTVDGQCNSLEVHLFDFNERIYGQRLHVSFLKKLRDEMKFDSLSALITQIYDDIGQAKTYFKQYSIKEPSFNPFSSE